MSRKDQHETLEIEGDEDRRRRLQSLMERMSTNDDGSSTNLLSNKPNDFPSFDFGDRTTREIKPNTELLSRIQEFLPQIEASNKALLERVQANPESVDIEHIEPGEQGYIEMNLGLGVYETKNTKGSKKKAASQDADSEDTDSDSDSGSASSDDSASTSDSGSDSDEAQDEDDTNDPLSTFLSSLRRHGGTDSEAESDTDSDSDSDSDIGISLPVSERVIKPLPRRSMGKAPKIEVLSESNTTTSTEQHEGGSAL